MPTKITWCDETWNPVVGCSKISPACNACYAEKIAMRFHATYNDVVTNKKGWTGKILVREHIMEQPLHWRKPRRIFVVSMGDLFHKNVPRVVISRIIGIMVKAHWHTFMLLTKRPDRMAKVLGWMEKGLGPLPKNIWCGTTIENQEQADARVPELLKVNAAVRFVSVEPCLSHLDLLPYLQGGDLNEQKGEGVSCTDGAWGIRGGRRRNNLAEGGACRRGNIIFEDASNSQKGVHKHQDGISGSRVYQRQGKDVRGSAQNRMDGLEPFRYPRGSGDKPQGRQQDELPPIEPGSRDKAAERESRHRGSWEKTQSPKWREERYGKTDDRGRGEDKDVVQSRISTPMENCQNVRDHTVRSVLRPSSEKLESPKLDWVICGGESGPGARPMHPHWPEDLRDQCVEAGVPFLFKQWGEWSNYFNGLHGLPGWPKAHGCHGFSDGMVVHKIGKKVAGRKLDGKLWDQYPEVK